MADQHAPLKEMKKTKKKTHIPWATSELDELLAERNNYLKLYRLYGCMTDSKIVKSLNNRITHLKRKLKKIYYTKKIETYEGDPKKMWKILKEVTQTGSKTEDVEPEFLDQNVANNFNNYFATVGTKVQHKLNVEEKEVNKDAQHTQTQN